MKCCDDRSCALEGTGAPNTESDARAREQMKTLTFILLAAVVVAMVSPATVFAYEDDDFGEICKAVMTYIEGGFGALLAAGAGLGAIVASAAGGFRVAWALLIVSIGGFILRAYLSIWFGDGCGE